MSKNNKKKQKPEEDDNGISFADMNVPGMPWYEKPEINKNKKKLEAHNLSRKEKRAIAFAGLLRALPVFLIVIGSFVLTAVLMWLWIR